MRASENIVGELPTEGLVVANRGADGKVYVGQPGDLHFSLSERYGETVRSAAQLKPGEPTWELLGFIDATGRFLTRQEAYRIITRTLPRFRPSDNMEGELDALDYREALGRGAD